MSEKLLKNNFCAVNFCSDLLELSNELTLHKLSTTENDLYKISPHVGLLCNYSMAHYISFYISTTTFYQRLCQCDVVGLINQTNTSLKENNYLIKGRKKGRKYFI